MARLTAAAAVVLTVAALFGGACRKDEPVLPEGVWLAGDAAVLRGLLEDFESFHGSRIARRSAEGRARIASCAEAVAHTDLGSAEAAGLLEALRCRDESGEPAALEALRGDADAVLAVTVAGATLVARLRRFSDGLESGWSAALELPAGDFQSAAAQLLPAPAGKAAGLTVLAGNDALFQGRFAADRGLDLGAWVTAQSAVDRMFRLKSEVFSSLVLSGVWELAMYAPSPGEEMPPIALAAEHREPRAARLAMERFLDELSKVWLLIPSQVRVKGLDGACYKDLRLLPALAPCYVVSDRALILGWNVASLERALAAPGRDLGGESRLLVDFDRFGAAEEILEETLRAPEERTPPETYPWRRLDVSGRRDGDLYLLNVRLVAKPPENP